MMKSKFTFAVSLVAVTSLGLACLTSLPSCKKSDNFEGEITLHMQSASGPESDMIFAASGDRVRLDLAAAGGKRSRALVKPDGKVVLVVDDEKAWMDMDLTKAGAAVAEADPSGAPVATKTGKRATIAGRECETWEIKHSSGKRTESCIAEGLAAFDFGALLPGGSPLPSGSESHQKKLFPLRSIEFDATGKETSRMLVTRIENKKLDEAHFEVPASYTKIERPGAVAK